MCGPLEFHSNAFTLVLDMKYKPLLLFLLKDARFKGGGLMAFVEVSLLLPPPTRAAVPRPLVPWLGVPSTGGNPS